MYNDLESLIQLVATQFVRVPSIYIFFYFETKSYFAGVVCIR